MSKKLNIQDDGVEETIQASKVEGLGVSMAEIQEMQKKKKNVSRMKSRNQPMTEAEILESLHSHDFYQAFFKDTLRLSLDRRTFTELVGVKAKEQSISLQIAELEVTIDQLIAKYNDDSDKAFINVVSLPMPPSKELLLVTKLLQRGANATITDAGGRSALHFTVRKGNLTATEKLLEYGAQPLLSDNLGATPLFIAISNHNAPMAGLLIRCINNYEVRKLFTRQGSHNPIYSLHELIELDMKEAVIAVLDSLIEVDSTSFYGDSTVYYSILEADKEGFTPDKQKFNREDKSCLHLLAHVGNEEALSHPVVSLLVSRKWNSFAKKNFILTGVIFSVSLVILTIAVIISLDKPDPSQYDASAGDIIRAMCELITIVTALLTICSEIMEIIKTGKDYFRDEFNVLDAGASVLILLLIPLRFTHTKAHWAVYSLVYCLSVNRVLKFAPIFRSMRSYVKIILTLIRTTFVWFLIMILIAAIAFTGSFALAVRVHKPTTPLKDCYDTPSTRNFAAIFVAALRIMIQGDNDEVIPYYTNEKEAGMTEDELNNGFTYGVFAAIVMAVYLFVVLVILLNILIAQLTDVYESLRQDSQVEVDINRAWIVVKVELHSAMNLIFKREHPRLTHYAESERVSADQLAEYKGRLTDDSKELSNMSDKLDTLDSNTKFIMDKLKTQQATIDRLVGLIQLHNMQREHDKLKHLISAPSPRITSPILESEDEDPDDAASKTEHKL